MEALRKPPDPLFDSNTIPDFFLFLTTSKNTKGENVGFTAGRSTVGRNRGLRAEETWVQARSQEAPGCAK